MDKDKTEVSSTSSSLEDTDEHKATSEVIVLNVGGDCFTTSKSTLQKYPDSMLYGMLTSKVPATKLNGAYFVDRDAKYFNYVLNFYRMGDKIIKTLPKSETSLEQIKLEFDFYLLPTTIFEKPKRGDLEEWKISILDNDSYGAYHFEAMITVSGLVFKVVALNYNNRDNYYSGCQCGKTWASHSALCPGVLHFLDSNKKYIRIANLTPQEFKVYNENLYLLTKYDHTLDICDFYEMIITLVQKLQKFDTITGSTNELLSKFALDA